jgi:hypothetical protein
MINWDSARCDALYDLRIYVYGLYNTKLIDANVTWAAFGEPKWVHKIYWWTQAFYRLYHASELTSSDGTLSLGQPVYYQGNFFGIYAGDSEDHRLIRTESGTFRISPDVKLEDKPAINYDVAKSVQNSMGYTSAEANAKIKEFAQKFFKN